MYVGESKASSTMPISARNIYVVDKGVFREPVRSLGTTKG